jgi:membrane-associated PAP2 superfamily phosphatase
MPNNIVKSWWLWAPVLVYLALLIPIELFDVDWALANFWFQLEGGQWSLKHHWITQALLHDTGHDISVAVYVIVLLLYGLSFKSQRLSPYSHGLSYLAVTIPLATLSVSLLKRLTRVDCPWSINDFGGQDPYQSWFSTLFHSSLGQGHCFPAGHASSAYMFFAVYLLSRVWWPKQSKWILAGIIVLGLTFGIAQQLRGAHFISHDLTSALICWVVSLLMWQRWSARIQPALPRTTTA